MSLKCLYLVLICTLAGCELFSKKDEPLHYSAETLNGVMQDLYVASEALKKIDPAEKDSFNQLFRKQIETIHDVNIVLLEEDIARLEEKPEMYRELHKGVRDSLIALEAVINAMSYD